jgi:hypothetical protein
MVSTGGNMLDLSLRRAALGSLLGLASIGLAGPALAQAAHTRHQAVAHHAKTKKKKKSKGGTRVTVHCASIGVTCKGRPGPAGATGPAGMNGAAGLNGLDGSRIIDRISTTGATNSTPETSCTLTLLATCPAVPISGGSWTEGPTEDNQFYGEVTMSLPDQEVCGYKKGESLPTAEVIVEIDGKIEGLTELRGQETSSTVSTIPILFNLAYFDIESAGSAESALIGTGFFMGNGASQPHAVTLLALDDCKGGVRPVLNSAAIDVFGTQ